MPVAFTAPGAGWCVCRGARRVRVSRLRVMRGVPSMMGLRAGEGDDGERGESESHGEKNLLGHDDLLFIPTCALHY